MPQKDSTPELPPVQGGTSRRRRREGSGKVEPDGAPAIVDETDEEKARRRRARKKAKQKALAEAGSEPAEPRSTRKKKRKKSDTQAEAPSDETAERAKTRRRRSRSAAIPADEVKDAEETSRTKKRRKRKSDGEDSAATAEIQDPGKTKRRRRKSEADAGAVPDADEPGKTKRRRRKKRAEVEGDAEGTGEELAPRPEDTKRRRRKRGDADSESRRLRRSKRGTTERVARELEQVDLDDAPQTGSVARVGKKRLARRPGEEEEALDSIQAPPDALDTIEALEGDEDLEPAPFGDPTSDSVGTSPFGSEIEEEEFEDFHDSAAFDDSPAPSHRPPPAPVPTSEVLLDLDSDDTGGFAEERPALEDSEREDDDYEERPRRQETSRRRRGETSRRRREELGDDLTGGPRDKKAHPLFIAAIIGIPAIAVLVMGYFKFYHNARTTGDGSSYSSSGDASTGGGATTGGERPKTTVEANWEEALALEKSLSAKIHAMTSRISDLQDRADAGNEVKHERRAMLQELRDLDREVDTLKDAGEALLEAMKSKTRELAIKKASRIVKNDVGKKLARFERMKEDIATKRRVAKHIGF